MRIDLNLFCSISVRMCRTGNWFYKHNPCLRQLFFFYFHNKGRVSVRIILKDLYEVPFSEKQWERERERERERENTFPGPIVYDLLLCSAWSPSCLCDRFSVFLSSHRTTHSKAEQKRTATETEVICAFVLDVTRGWILFNSLPVALWLAPSVAAVTKRLPKLL